MTGVQTCALPISLDDVDGIVSRVLVVELRGGHVRRRRVLLHKRRRWGSHGGFREFLGDPDGSIHSERTIERVSGRDIRYVCLGDIRVVEEDAHGARKQIVIARVLDSALRNRRRVNSILPKALDSRTCRYAIGDLRGVVMWVITASKGTTATSTL